MISPSKRGLHGRKCLWLVRISCFKNYSWLWLYISQIPLQLVMFPFVTVADPGLPPQELEPNEGVMPPPRLIVGGQLNRWLNITRTVTVQGAEDPDSNIYMCEVCRNVTTLEGCSAANYTQFTIGSPPVLEDASGETT